MNISCISSVVGILFLLSFECFSQSNFESFNENEFAINHSVNSRYKVNFSLSNRNWMYTDEQLFFKTRQVQISHFSSIKMDLKNSVSVGLLYRNRSVFEDSSNEIRLTQQYVYKTLMSAIRVGHRFRSEQRFYSESTTFRFRYRFTIDLPLQGLKLDTGESFFVLSNEALWSLNKFDTASIDYRLSPTVGWKLTDDFVLSVGVEYIV